MLCLAVAIGGCSPSFHRGLNSFLDQIDGHAVDAPIMSNEDALKLIRHHVSEREIHDYTRLFLRSLDSVDVIENAFLDFREAFHQAYELQEGESTLEACHNLMRTHRILAVVTEALGGGSIPEIPRELERACQ